MPLRLPFHKKLSSVAISFLLCFCESLLQSHHQSLLDVFQFFNEFLQTSFALTLLRVHPPFISGALETKLWTVSGIEFWVIPLGLVINVLSNLKRGFPFISPGF